MARNPEQAAAEAIYDAFECRHTLTPDELAMKPADLAARRAIAAIAQAEAEQDAADGWDWAIVEIFGHRKHAGRIREEERFGAKLLRIDVPQQGDPDAHGWLTHFYAGGSIFSLTPCDRAAAMAANKPWEPSTRLSIARQTDSAFDDEEGPFG